MRLLHVVPSYYPAHVYGGPIVSLHRLACAQVQQGLDVRVLTSNANGPGRRLPGLAGRWVTEHGVPTRYCAVLAGNDTSAELAQKLPGLLRWAELCHVTAVFSPTSLLGLLGTPLRPLVLSPRGSLLPWALGQGRGRKRRVLQLLGPLLRRVAGWHATSADEAASIRALLGEAPVPIHVIENGVDAEEVREVPLPDPSLGGVIAPGEGPVMIVMGRIDPVKGLDLALLALRELRQRHPRAVLLLVGPDRDGHGVGVRRDAERLGLSDAVRFTGLLTGEDKRRALARGAVLWLCSKMESFGNVVIEALAVGTPVVAVQTTPWAWLEQAGVGRWVSREAAAIAAATVELLAEPDPLARSRRCREAVARRFTWPEIARRMGALYAEARLARTRP